MSFTPLECDGSAGAGLPVEEDPLFFLDEEASHAFAELFLMLRSCRPRREPAATEWLERAEQYVSLSSKLKELKASYEARCEEIEVSRRIIISLFDEPRVPQLTTEAFDDVVLTANNLLLPLSEEDRQAVIAALQKQQLKVELEKFAEQLRRLKETQSHAKV